MLFAVDAAGVPSVSRDRRAAPARSRPTPAPVNLALNRPATGSTRLRHRPRDPRRPSTAPCRAAGPTSSARRWPDRWLQVDLGSSRTVSTLRRPARRRRRRVASLNTRAYRIETRTTGGTWSTAVDRHRQHRERRPPRRSRRASARYVRLVVTALRAGQRRRRRADLRVRGLQRRRAGGAAARAADRLLGPRRDRPRAALRGRRLRRRRAATWACRRRRDALARVAPGYRGDALPRPRPARLHDARRGPALAAAGRPRPLRSARCGSGSPPDHG